MLIIFRRHRYLLSNESRVNGQYAEKLQQEFRRSRISKRPLLGQPLTRRFFVQDKPHTVARVPETRNALSGSLSLATERSLRRSLKVLKSADGSEVYTVMPSERFGFWTTKPRRGAKRPLAWLSRRADKRDERRCRAERSECL